jgi:hypothetical protein
VEKTPFQTREVLLTSPGKFGESFPFLHGATCAENLPVSIPGVRVASLASLNPEEQGRSRQHPDPIESLRIADTCIHLRRRRAAGGDIAGHIRPCGGEEIGFVLNATSDSFASPSPDQALGGKKLAAPDHPGRPKLFQITC